MAIETAASSKESALLSTVVESTDQDDYVRYKKLEKQMEHLDVMEEYVKLETRNLEKELLHAQEEVHQFFELEVQDLVFKAVYTHRFMYSI